MRSRKTIHLIGNAHLDPVWLWRWPEGCSELRATCRAVAQFLETDPTLCFARSSAGDLRWITRLEPALTRRIRRLVRQGRWENVGGWWTQPDCNLPCGESFVRQALYGQAFFRRELGGEARVGYNVDSFGHHANLPQLLAQARLPGYVFMRPGHSENSDIPDGYFWWEGVDGSRVLAFRIFDPYNATDTWGLDKAMARTRDYLDRTGAPSAMLFFGVGDHGGGPTRECLAAIDRLRSEPGQPELRFATPSSAFAAVRRERRSLPVWKGELQHHASGCYAAHGEIKQLNRRAEQALLAAEKLSAVARVWASAPYPAKALRAAWQDLLFNQFHDILAGSSVRTAYDDARDQLGRATATAEECLNDAQQRLALRIDTRGEGQAIVLFNPQAVAFDGLYESENLSYGIAHWSINLRTARLVAADGTEALLQAVEPTARSGGLHRTLMRVRVPALGYRVFWFRTATEGAARPAAPLSPAAAVSPLRLRNGVLSLEVLRRGLRIRDVASGREVVRAPGIRPLVLDDPGDTWGHDITAYDRVAGAFELQGSRVLENGPLRAALRVEYRFGASRLWLDVLLEADSRTVELRGKVWWLERQRLLKLAIPVNACGATATHSIPFAALERPMNGDEEPIQKWVDVSGHNGGLAVINAGHYSVSVTPDAEIRLTLLRSTPYAWTRCKAYPWAGQDAAWHDEDDFMDQGVQRFRLLLVAHDGDWRAAGVVSRAEQFNRGLALLPECSHPGPMPPQGSFLAIEGEGIRLAALKQAEDGRGWIVRLVETHGRRSRARVSAPPLAVRFSATLRPWEIRTYLVRGDRAVRVPVLEHPLPPTPSEDPA